MRFALVALISAVAALAQPTAFAPRPLNPPNLSPDFHGWDPAPAVIKRAPVTNAERFAQGLPPLKSKARRHRGGPHHDPSYGSHATRVRSARRAETSPTPPITTTCKLRVTDTDGNPQGYVSPTWNDYGEYGATQVSPDNALEITFTYPVDSPSQLNMVATNGPNANYPIVGAATGFSSDSSDFEPGEFSYAYLTGTESVPAGPPQDAGSAYKEASGFDDVGTESAIWTYDPATQYITPQWINTDGSMATTYTASVDNVFILTGDTGVPSALGDATMIKFKCEPVIAAPV